MRWEHNLAPMFATFILGFIIVMIGTLGVNQPGGCGQNDQASCFAADTCGWLCVQEYRCYCFPSTTADWAPVKWMVAVAVCVIFASVGGCFLHVRSTRQLWHPYDAL